MKKPQEYNIKTIEQLVDIATKDKLIRWVNFTEEKPKQNGLYFWMGKSNYGGYSFYDINHGFDFPDDVPTNKVDEQYLKWLKDE